MTALILAPSWRFGRRALATRLVTASVERWRRHAPRLIVACEAAAAPSFQDLGDNEVLVVSEETAPLDTLQRALEADVDGKLLLVDAAACPLTPEPAFPALLGALEDPALLIAAVHDPVRGLLRAPLLCRPMLRFQIEALRDEGRATLEELLRGPFGRVVPLD